MGARHIVERALVQVDIVQEEPALQGRVEGVGVDALLGVALVGGEVPLQHLDLAERVLEPGADVVAEAEEPGVADQPPEVRPVFQSLVVEQRQLGFGVALLDLSRSLGGQGRGLLAQGLELGGGQEVRDHHVAVAPERAAQLGRDQRGQGRAAQARDPMGRQLAAHVEAQPVQGAAADHAIGAERLGPREQLERPERDRQGPGRLDHPSSRSRFARDLGPAGAAWKVLRLSAGR